MIQIPIEVWNVSASNWSMCLGLNALPIDERKPFAVAFVQNFVLATRGKASCTTSIKEGYGEFWASWFDPDPSHTIEQIGQHFSNVTLPPGFAFSAPQVNEKRHLVLVTLVIDPIAFHIGRPVTMPTA